MNTTQLHHKYILVATVFVVYYPIKGLFNLTYYFFQFEAFPYLFNKFIFILMIISLITLFLYKHFEINRYGFKLLLTVTAIALSTLAGDPTLIQNVFLLILLPLLFSIFDNGQARYSNRVLISFFKFIIIYMSIEFILLNLRFEGSNLISQDIYQEFYKIISPNGTPIDFRHSGSSWAVRSGGFLGDPLAMPVLVLISTIFFYVNYRLYNKYLFYVLIGMFLVIASISTTAMISLIFTILVFEFQQKRFVYIIKMMLLSGPIIVLHPNLNFIIRRITTNYNDPNYKEVFFDMAFLTNVKTYLSLLVGNWQWISGGVSSHLDIILIPMSMGLIGFYALYTIFIRGFLVYRNKNCMFTAYAYILLSAFVCLYHHQMTLNLNVMIIVVFISNMVNNNITTKYKLNIKDFITK